MQRRLVVVSSGPFHAFHVVFLPLEYILAIPPHSTFVIVFVAKERKKGGLTKYYGRLNYRCLHLQLLKSTKQLTMTYVE